VLEETLVLREYDLKVSNITLERDLPDDMHLVVQIRTSWSSLPECH